MSESVLREQDKRLDALIQTVADVAFKQGETAASDDEVEDAINAVHEYIAELRTPAVREPCVWSQDEEGAWDTTCGGLFEFADGWPSENGAKYCCYCGGVISEVAYVDEVEE